MLFGIQTYWSQIFLLPKKILKEMETHCRVFIWTGQAGFSRKALVSWAQMCLPKVSGGWNISKLEIWNKASVVKHIVHILCNDPDSILNRWVKSTFIKEKSFLSAHGDLLPRRELLCMLLV